MFPILGYAVEMLNIIKNAGYEAYAVGGCVRDAVLGTEPSDIDITTSADPDAIQSLFPHSVRTGGKFFTVTVFHNGGKAEITPFRSEGGYSDSRRPDTVAIASELTEDLERRDFTMNTLCFDGEKIIDLLGGKTDIENKLIRCVGEPERRFDEDALRIMRAFRFSAELGFEIEPKTLSAALSESRKLQRISVERIRDELIKTLLSPAPERLSPLLEEGGLGFLNLTASPLLPRIKELRTEISTRLSAFFYICGRDAPALMKLPTRLKRDISGVFGVLDSLPPPTKSGVKRAMSRFSAAAFASAAEIAEKLYGAPAEYSALCRAVTESGEPYRISDLAVNGADLMNAGVPEKEIGAALERLLDAVIDAPELNDRKPLMAMITK